MGTIMSTKEQYLEYLISKGWDLHLVSTIIDTAGDYDVLCAHKTAVCELLFINSMSSRPNLKEDEPAALCSSVVLSDIEFLNEANTTTLSKLFSDQRAAISRSLINNWSQLGLDPAVELTHLTHRISDSEVIDFFNDSDISVEAMRYIIITTYYALLVDLANLQGELNGDRLASLDLSKLKQIQCTNAQLILDSGSQVKLMGFIDDSEMLDQIYRDYYIDFSFGEGAGAGKKYVQYLNLINKDQTAKLLPVKLSCGELTHLMASGRSFVEAVMNNKADKHVALDCVDSSVVDIKLDIGHNFDFNISGTAKVVAVGECGRINMLADEQCTLFGTKLESEHFWSSCSDESKIFVNSVNFTDDKEFRSDASGTTVVNNAIIPDHPDYIIHCQEMQELAEGASNE